MARYIPVVRTKSGEADALGNLTAAARDKILPLVRMTGQVPVTFWPKLIANCAGFPMALDGSYNFLATGSAVAYTALFNSIVAGGVPLIPVLWIRGDPNYNAAAAGLAVHSGGRFVLNVPIADLPLAENWVLNAHCSPSDVDLLLDAGGVAEHDPLQIGPYICHVIGNTLAAGHPWRSVTLHCWSAPKDHGPLNAGRNNVQRRDWQTWQQVSPLLPFQLDYSDCGHVHPSLDEVPGYVMGNATVSVRYAVDNIWIIYKGVPVSGPNGIDMGTQYRGHAQTLTADPAFGGVPGCWGDTRVQHYAVTAGGAGARAQWAALLLNRHLSLVADRLP